MSDPLASPIDVARAVAKRGATREAELILRGSLARDPSDGECRVALATLQRDGRLPKGPDEPLDLALVDLWIRRGMLVEALALLGGVDLGGTAREWADLLGELLAPVPAQVEGCFVDMQRALLSGGASVALAILEDRCRLGPVPAWAARRLSLLRWMLLDNAQSAATDSPCGEAPTQLAGAIRGPLSLRDIEGMLAAAEAYAGGHPESADARGATRMLALLVEEMNDQVGEIELSIHTVPVFGRPAAAMQLRMANLPGALSIYRKLSSDRPGDARLQLLFDAVTGVQRVVDGRAAVDRSFPPPPREDLEKALGIAPVFADKTAAKSVERVLEQVRAESAALEPGDDVTRVVRDPLAPYSDETRAVALPPEAKGLEFEDQTRPAFDGELPLAAFDDEVTVQRMLPEAPPQDTERFDMDEIAVAVSAALGTGTASESASEPRGSEIGEARESAPCSDEDGVGLSEPTRRREASTRAEPDPPPEAFETLRDPPAVLVRQIKGIGGDS